MSKQSEAQRSEALEHLRSWLKPGDTIYTILRHVSRSGMQREISLYAMIDGRMQWLDGVARHVLGMRIGRHEGLIVGGCGMDMGFHLVYNLAVALWPEGFGCVGQECSSNDHSNGDRDYTLHGENGAGTLEPHQHWHREGGYALRQRWL